MSSKKMGLRRVGIVGLSTLVATTMMTGVASANSTFAFTRMAGADRYATSVATAQQFGASTDVILASGENGHYPDALTANYLAGAKHAPILLTHADATPANIAAQIAASGATHVWIIGGTTAISAAQAASLAGSYTVTRLGGADRYATASQVMGAVTATSHTALLATGDNFPDALGGGALSYAKGMPLAITQSNTLTPSTLAALKSAGTTSVLVLGGTVAISQGVVDSLAANGITLAQRFNGAFRSETSSLLADYEITSQGFSATAVNVASGYEAGGGADALGGSALSGQETRPLLITDSNVSEGAAVDAFLVKHAPTLANGFIFGGTFAVSQAVQDSMTTAAQTVTSNQTYTVTPNTATTVDIATGHIAYTVTGLDNTKTYDLALFAPGNVQSGTAYAGVTTFTGSNPGGTGNVALNGTTTGATITVINGVAVTGGANPQIAVAPSGGQITFTVTDTTTAGVSVVPVVYSRTDGNELLNLGTNNQPTDTFGVGGAANFVSYATAGTTINATVAAIGAATFTDGTHTYKYASTDVYQLWNAAGNAFVSSTYAEFQSLLSKGDTVTGYYNSPNQSTFQLADVAPAGPTATATENSTQGGVTLGWTITPANEILQGVSGYSVLRAAAIPPGITGGATTCPTLSTTGTPAAGWTAIKSLVADPTTAQQTVPTFTWNSTTGAYVFMDTTASAGTGTTANQYCYAISSVSPNAAGTTETGVAVATNPTFASAGVPAPIAGAPAFAVTQRAATGTTVTVDYNQAILTSSVDAATAAALDYTVTVTTTGGVSTPATITGIAPSNLGTSGVGQVVLTLGSTVSAGETVVVHAATGTDGNTVLNQGTPALAQATTDAIQITAT